LGIPHTTADPKPMVTCSLLGNTDVPSCACRWSPIYARNQG
jgi:hypothetical protein